MTNSNKPATPAPKGATRNVGPMDIGLDAGALGSGRGSKAKGPINLPLGDIRESPVRRGSKRAVALTLMARAEGATPAEIGAAADAAVATGARWAANDAEEAKNGIRAACGQVGYGCVQLTVDGPAFLLHPNRPALAEGHAEAITEARAEAEAKGAREAS